MKKLLLSFALVFFPCSFLLSITSPAFAALFINDVFTTTISESLVAAFVVPGSGTTSNLYKDFVQVQVSGTGQAKAQRFNDAFYFLDDQSDLLNNGLLHISFTGDARQVEADGVHVINYMAFIDGRGYVSFERPDYNLDHYYNFVIDIGQESKNITLGTGDGGLFDNSGQFNITVSQSFEKSGGTVIPEPSTILIFGFGLLGLIFRPTMRMI